MQLFRCTVAGYGWWWSVGNGGCQEFPLGIYNIRHGQFNVIAQVLGSKGCRTDAYEAIWVQAHTLHITSKIQLLSDIATEITNLGGLKVQCLLLGEGGEVGRGGGTAGNGVDSGQRCKLI